MCSLWSIRLVIFANQTLKHMISHIQQSSVRTGIANALGEFSIFHGQNIIKIALVKVHLTTIISASQNKSLHLQQTYISILAAKI